VNRARFGAVSTDMARRRPHADIRREHRLTAWFTGAEIAKIRLEAERHGMAPAAWLAKTGTDAAEPGDTGGRGLADDAADAIADMNDATGVARKIGYEFNQALAALHSTGRRSPALEASGDAVARAVRRMEAATLRAARELLR
jgi:hypothetical protein